MVWVRIDDRMAEHPKLADAGPLGLAMQVAALCYCNRNLTDGFVPVGAARLLLDLEGLAIHTGPHSLDDVRWNFVVGSLVDSGMWHEPGHDCEDCPQFDRGYYLHSFLEFQPSKDKVEDGRGAARQRMRDLRSKRGTNVRANNEGSSDSVRETFDDSRTRTRTPETPKDFVATEVATKKVPKAKKPPTYTDDFNDFWAGYPRHPDNGKPGGGGTKLEAWSAWGKLGEADRVKAVDVLDQHARALRKSNTPPKHAHRFLNLREFDSYDEVRAARAARVTSTCGWHCGLADDDHDDALCRTVTGRARNSVVVDFSRGGGAA